MPSIPRMTDHQLIAAAADLTEDLGACLDFDPDEDEDQPADIDCEDEDGPLSNVIVGARRRKWGKSKNRIKRYTCATTPKRGRTRKGKSVWLSTFKFEKKDGGVGQMTRVVSHGNNAPRKLFVKNKKTDDKPRRIRFC